MPRTPASCVNRRSFDLAHDFDYFQVVGVNLLPTHRHYRGLMAYWYNVSTKQIETDENRSAAANLLGPYATREQAEGAIEASHNRTERDDDADKRWNGDDD
jgi:hypothetical protein